MKISKQARRDARQLFRACMPSGALDENRARQAVAGVIQKKPRGYIAILSHLQRLVRLEVARRTATIESATALAAAGAGGNPGRFDPALWPGSGFYFYAKSRLDWRRPHPGGRRCL